MPSAIGLLNERSLHAELKRWYAEPGDRFEAQVDGYVVDIVRGELLIEIQTGGFSSIRRKLRALLVEHPLRVVHPIPLERWIVKLAPGSRRTRRRSPRRGHPLDVFAELVAFPDLVAHPGFTLEVLLTREDDVREPAHPSGRARGRRRRRPWRTLERRLLEVADRWTIRGPEDLQTALPDDLPDPFGTAELARACGRPRWLAQKMTYCLAHAGALREVGRAGNARLYSRAAPPA